MELHVCPIPSLRAKPIDRHCSSLAPDLPAISTTSPRVRINIPGSHLEGEFTNAKRAAGHRSVHSQRNINAMKCLSSDYNQASLSAPNQVVELPLFPLNLVFFPGATLPLQIYEFRYRIMMHTLLQSDLRFGIVYSDSSGGIVDVGCVAEVVKHKRLVDDRFFIICKGQERFRVTNLVQTKPYMVAEVQWLEDWPSADNNQQDLESLALDVENCMKNVIRLSNKLSGKAERGGDDLRGGMFPTAFSFFVGSTFEGSPKEQQALLELEDTAVRLKREKETLRNTLNYLVAASAVKDAFQYSSNEN